MPRFLTCNIGNMKSFFRYLILGGSPQVNPSEKYDRQNGFIFPKIGLKITKYLKPPSRPTYRYWAYDPLTFY